MKKELVDSLYQRYPAIFAEHILLREEEDHWTICCRDGWFDLIDTLCEQLQFWTDTRNAPQFVATSVKEKFGALRFVAQSKSAEQMGAVKMAYAMSTRLCEECGAPGRLVVDGGCWMTRCEPHIPEGSITPAEFNRPFELRQRRIKP
ncbi:hypothetical protein [Propionivibrio sp.]|uniref:hypothetical protein n=1 Tax=Propionivibrio sp. TaxID=2212460 RepID=UPI003BF290CE